MDLGAGATAIRAPQPEVGIDKEAVKRAFLDKLFSIQGKFPKLATRNDYYMALAYTVRDMMLCADDAGFRERWAAIKRRKSRYAQQTLR